MQGILHCRLKQAVGEVTLAEVSLALGISTDLTYWSEYVLSLRHGHFMSPTDRQVTSSYSQRSSWQTHLTVSSDLLESAKSLLSASDAEKNIPHGEPLFSCLIRLYNS